MADNNALAKQQFKKRFMDLLSQQEDYTKRDFTIFCFSTQRIKKNKSFLTPGLFRLDIRPCSKALECWEICSSQLDDKTGNEIETKEWIFDVFSGNMQEHTATLIKYHSSSSEEIAEKAEISFSEKGYIETVSIYPDALSSDSLLYTNCMFLNSNLLSDEENVPQLFNLAEKDIFDLQHFCLHFTSYGVGFKTRVAFQWLAELLQVYALKVIKKEEYVFDEDSGIGKKGVTTFLLNEILLLRTKSVLSLFKINRQMKDISLKERKDTEVSWSALQYEYNKCRNTFMNFTLIMFILNRLVCLEDLQS